MKPRLLRRRGRRTVRRRARRKSATLHVDAHRRHGALLAGLAGDGAALELGDRHRPHRVAARGARRARARNRPLRGDGRAAPGEAGRRRHRRDDRRFRDDPRRRDVLARLPRLQHDHEPHRAGRAGRVLRERGRPSRSLAAASSSRSASPAAETSRSSRWATRTSASTSGSRRRSVSFRITSRSWTEAGCGTRVPFYAAAPGELDLMARLRRHAAARAVERLGPRAVHRRDDPARLGLGEAGVNVTFVKSGARRYGVRVERVRAPALCIESAPGYDDHLPHDVLHFVAEAEFGLDGGVFGDLAAGGNARIFVPVDRTLVAKMWRRERKHRTRLPDGRRSEELAAALYAAWHKRRSDDPRVDRLIPSLDDLAQRWHALPAGGSLTLEWPRAERGRRGARHANAAGAARPAARSEHRVRGPRRRPAELRRRDPANAAVDAGVFEDRLGEVRPRALAVGGDVPEPARQLDELARRRREMADEGRGAALVVDDRRPRPARRPSRSIVRTKLWPVQPKSHDERTIHAFSPAAASPCSFVRPYAECGFGASDSTYGSRFVPSKT